MKKSNVYITSAVRTAVASLGKTLKNVQADELGACVIENALIKSDIKKNEVDEINDQIKDSELNNSKIEKELEESKSNIKDLEDKLSQINSIYSELKR